MSDDDDEAIDAIISMARVYYERTGHRGSLVLPRSVAVGALTSQLDQLVVEGVIEGWGVETTPRGAPALERDFELEFPILSQWEQTAEDDPVEPIWGWLGALGLMVTLVLVVEWILARSVW